MIAFSRLAAVLWLSSAFITYGHADNCRISSRDLKQLRKDACPGGRGQITVTDSGKVNWKDVRDMELEEFFHQTQSLVVPENSIISIDSKQLKVLNFGQLNAIKGPASARMKIVDSGVEAVDFSRLDIEIAVEIRHNKQLGKILFGEGKAYNIYDVSHNPSLCHQSLHNFLKLHSAQQPVKNCDRFCWDLADLEEKKTCPVLKKDFVVDGSGGLPSLHRVVEIHGRVEIGGNSEFTDVSDTFHHLRRIEYNGTGPALMLTYNKNLANFIFPMLEKVTGGQGKQIIIRGNQRPLLVWEKEKLLEQTGLAEKDVEIPTVSNWAEETTTSPGNTTSSSKHGAKWKNGSLVRTIIGAAVLFPILIGSVIFIVYWIVVAKRKTPRGEESKETKKPPQQRSVQTGSRPTTTATASQVTDFLPESDASERGEEDSPPETSNREEWTKQSTEPAAPQSTVSPTQFEPTPPPPPRSASEKPRADNIVTVPPRPSVMPSYTFLAPPPKAPEPEASTAGTRPATPGAVAIPPKKSLLPPVVLM